MQKLLGLALVLSLSGLYVTDGNAPQNQHNIMVCGGDSCYPHDCSDISAQGFSSDGVYMIYPAGPFTQPVPVYCDMTSPGGPWTVFQKRFDGSVDFYRGWVDYRSGFGRADGEYWLGLQNIHHLTRWRKYRLRVDLGDFENNKRFVTYEDFSLSRLAVSAEEDRYKLSIAGFKEGDPLKPAGDSLSIVNGMNFSTYDHDGDTYANGSCAVRFSGAFWYSRCHSANLNGKYLKGNTTEYAKGMVWRTWTGHYYSLKSTEMKIAVSPWPQATFG